MHVAGWVEVLCYSPDLERGCLSLFNVHFLQARHMSLTKKKILSASSLEQQILSLERQRREVILSLPLTFTDINSKIDITVSVIDLRQEITEDVITVFVLPVTFTHHSNQAHDFLVGISSCALVREFLHGDFFFAFLHSVQAHKIILKLIPVVMLLSTKLGRVIYWEAET